MLHLLSVEGDLGVEDLVAAVLGVRLREHHQLHVRGIARELREGVREVVDLVGRQGQAQLRIGALEGELALGAQRDALEGARRLVAKERTRLVPAVEHALGHGVVEQIIEGAAPWQIADQAIGHAALDTPHLREATAADDLRGLGRPGRQRTEARNHQTQQALLRGFGHGPQEASQASPLLRRRRRVELHKM